MILRLLGGDSGENETYKKKEGTLDMASPTAKKEAIVKGIQYLKELLGGDPKPVPRGLGEVNLRQQERFARGVKSTGMSRTKFTGQESTGPGPGAVQESGGVPSDIRDDNVFGKKFLDGYYDKKGNLLVRGLEDELDAVVTDSKLHPSEDFEGIARSNVRENIKKTFGKKKSHVGKTVDEKKASQAGTKRAAISGNPQYLPKGNFPDQTPPAATRINEGGHENIDQFQATSRRFGTTRKIGNISDKAPDKIVKVNEGVTGKVSSKKKADFAKSEADLEKFNIQGSDAPIDASKAPVDYNKLMDEATGPSDMVNRQIDETVGTSLETKNAPDQLDDLFADETTKEAARIKGIIDAKQLNDPDAERAAAEALVRSSVESSNVNKFIQDTFHMYNNTFFRENAINPGLNVRKDINNPVRAIQLPNKNPQTGKPFTNKEIQDSGMPEFAAERDAGFQKLTELQKIARNKSGEFDRDQQREALRGIREIHDWLISGKSKMQVDEEASATLQAILRGKGKTFHMGADQGLPRYHTAAPSANEMQGQNPEEFIEFIGRNDLDELGPKSSGNLERQLRRNQSGFSADQGLPRYHGATPPKGVVGKVPQGIHPDTAAQNKQNELMNAIFREMGRRGMID